MTDNELKKYLFERYTNMPEFWREELKDGSFCPKIALVDAMTSSEEDVAKWQDENLRLETEIESWRMKMIGILKGLGVDVKKSHDWDTWTPETLQNLGERHKL